jgi:hypothetical protein
MAETITARLAVAGVGRGASGEGGFTMPDKPETQEDKEEAKEQVKQLEEDPPEKLEDWPDGAAKYETFGGPEHDTTYDESAAAKLGPADVRHHEDGSVTVGGEKVDNPDDYKGDPIPGGPTDPDAPDLPGERIANDDDVEVEGRSEGEGDDD